MSTPVAGPFDLCSHRLGALPIVNHFLDRAGLPALLARYLPAADARCRLDPATAVRLLVANLLTGRAPLYALGEWAAPFAPQLLGLTEAEQQALGDDQLGRALDRLFDADRASLLTELMLGVVAEFAVDTTELHNDSTSISVHGVYRWASGAPRGGKATPVVTFGHSKDHRPDLKQLVWILTVSADGAVPVAHRLADGNTNDDPTHIPTWDGLVAAARAQRLPLRRRQQARQRGAMSHIHIRGGRFVTVLPRNRSEDKWFRDWAQTHRPDWTEAARRPGARSGEPDRVHYTFGAPLPCAEGHRIIWILSTAKAAATLPPARPASKPARPRSTPWPVKLAGPKCRYKTIVAVETAAAEALDKAGASRWLTVTVTATTEESFRQEHRGRPGADTRYRKTTRTRHTISWNTRLDVLAHDAVTDGMFPLVTNDTLMTDTQVLAAYRYQPHLERRHHLLKSVQNAAPLFLRSPARIEALFCCHFLALVISALIEREVRTTMTAAGTPDIRLYPEQRACTAPSTERILETFAELTRHELHRGPVSLIWPHCDGLIWPHLRHAGGLL